MDQKKPHLGSTYRIRIHEALQSTSTGWFGEIAVLPQENDETLLCGFFTDQAALRGFLEQLWNLNFTLLSLERVETQDHPVSHPPETEGRPK